MAGDDARGDGAHGDGAHGDGARGDNAPQVDASEPDATEVHPTGLDASDADLTTVEPAGAESRFDEPTVVTPAADGIAPGGPDDAEHSRPRWSARAPVRPAGADDDHYRHYREDWATAAAPRGVMVPVLIAVCVVLLVSFIGGGLWFALRDAAVTPTSAPAPTTTKAPAPTTTTVPRTKPATRAPTTPASTGPAVVEIPDVSGSDYNTAAATLSEIGFVPARVERTDTEVPAGEVIETDPPAGTAAVPGLRVDIVISTGPPEPPEPTETPTSPPAG